MMQLMVIVDGPDACARCLGWGHLASDDEGTPWKYWAELRPPENLAVQIGLVFPVQCPRCEGSGKEPSAAELADRLHAALSHLRGAWDRLSHCTDEFEDDIGACAEYRDLLDTAIIAVLAAYREAPGRL